MSRSEARIRVGVAGWDYPDWRGPVYPSRGGDGLDRLDWIARFVETVEINSTFYRPAAPRAAQGWVRRTAAHPAFVFTAKAHRSWTHERSPRPADDVRRTLEGLAPLRDAGRLGALLVQFPQSFHATRESLDHLARLVEHAAGWPLVAELRHASWGRDEATTRVLDGGLGWCAVDQPRVGPSTLGTLPLVSGPVGYLRLHGRNTRDWFRPDAGRDARYDYRYSPDELAGLAETAREMAGRAESLFVVQNNHFRGQALVNALQLRGMLESSRPLAPDALVAAYPDLAPDVVTEQGRLL